MRPAGAAAGSAMYCIVTRTVLIVAVLSGPMTAFAHAEAAPPPLPAASPETPSVKSALKLQSEVENERHQAAEKERGVWVAQRCSRVIDDPQCQFHLKKQLYRAMRAL